MTPDSLDTTAPLSSPTGRSSLQPGVQVLSVGVTTLSFKEHVTLLTEWARRREGSRVVCAANGHMLVEARRDSTFATILREADAVTPDGVPLLWLVRRRGAPGQDRVAGMDLLPALCAAAERAHIPIYFIGSTLDVLQAIERRLQREYPQLCIAGMESPPFRESTPDEDEATVARIENSQAGFVFVSLGCPKQERWMHAHRGRVRAVMVGLGAAFAVYAGLEPRAPQFMRQLGLEWLFRLIREPRRLWKRYAVTNTLFAWYVLQESLGQRFARRTATLPPP